MLYVKKILTLSLLFISYGCGNNPDPKKPTRSSTLQPAESDKSTIVKTVDKIDMEESVKYNLAALNTGNSALKIMPIGDSITQADTGNNWRCFLWGYLRQHAEFANINFVGSQKNPYAGSNSQCIYGNYDSDHEGHGGWTTDQVLGVLASSASAYAPDIALIHMGTNDLAGGQTPESTVNEVASMVNYLRAANGYVVIFIAGIIPNAYTVPDVNGTIINYNSQLASYVSANTQKNSPLIYVDQNSGFVSATDSNDKLHPNYNGHVKMASMWYLAIHNYYTNNSTAPVQNPTPTPTQENKNTSQPQQNQTNTGSNTNQNPSSSASIPTGSIQFSQANVSDTQIGLVWNEVVGATYYTLLTSTETGNLPITTYQSNWAIIDTNPKIKHYFSVFACNSAGCNETSAFIGPVSK